MQCSLAGGLKRRLLTLTVFGMVLSCRMQSRNIALLWRVMRRRPVAEADDDTVCPRIIVIIIIILSIHHLSVASSRLPTRRGHVHHSQ